MQAGVAAQTRGEDRQAAEDKVLDVLEPQRPCRGVDDSRRELYYLDAEDEFGKG